MNKKTRQKVYEKYNGRCAYCGCKLPDRWHVDHIYPKSKYKYAPMIEEMENLNPSCPSCNVNKRVMDVDEFRTWIEKTNTKALNKLSAQYRISKKFGVIKETGIKIKFYFEQVEANE